jgi:hypothetical protein
MSKYKDGFTNQGEAHEVHQRDLLALQMMKELEKKFRKNLKAVKAEGFEIQTTVEDIEESPLFLYVNSQTNGTNVIK